MRALAAALVLAGPLLASAADTLPPGLVAAGHGRLTWFGLSVYDARLWVAPAFRRSTLGDAPLALELTYERTFKAADVARRSLAEIARQGPLPADLAQRWEEQLRGVLVDVQPGDRVMGVLHPGHGLELFGNGRRLGAIGDADFARRFFAIWLGPATSEPALRDALLAGTAP